MPKLKVVTFPRPPAPPPSSSSSSSATTAGAAPIKLTVAAPPPSVPPPAAKSQQQQDDEDDMDEDEMALVDAEEAEGVVDVEMTAAVAGEAPVLLREEGAIEAYAEARSEQQKQLEELKAKVRGREGEKGRRGVGWYVLCSSKTHFVPPSLPPLSQRSTIEEQAAATGADKSQRKLEYLMAQSEMFAHFLGAQVRGEGGREGGREGS